MKQLAVLGSPVAQALSPVLHRAAYQAMGLDWAYHAIECLPEELPGFLHGLDGSWAGLSLTMPLKRAVLPLLDDASETVRQTGTANTIVVHHGRLLGDNTDLHGMLQALREAGVTSATSVTVIGAGATAGTALAAARHLGCHHAHVIARNPDRADHLLNAAERIEIRAGVRSWATASDHLSAGLVISAVPPGAADHLAPHWPRGAGAFLDVVYQPWPTPCAVAARNAGRTVISGLPMLVHQAARQVVLQTGQPRAPYADMLRAANEALTTAP
ncbi:shikimate dehydrogenase [Actinacidiphila yanglinensis]|uniref:Shikimate dehydrogenase n=1 Tax=Actinacidiphila yanglinensis TaxID=310779 RepID=A0A1H6EAH9_9ACTN|nr:shikimate dehydrogenase [Actinacidiphila yanglinensis]SEG94868.1 shikimate dehydrogenase [Actinacidiphila yanglinensis]